MDVIFASQQLLDAYEDEALGRRLWGADVARKYVERVDVLYNTATGADLYAIQSLRIHALKGDREGQYALRLTGGWRLIVTFENESMSVVCVEEVSKHYE